MPSRHRQVIRQAAGELHSTVALRGIWECRASMRIR
jgi:hypothetical protein